MRPPYAAAGLICLLAAPAAFAQDEPRRGARGNGSRTGPAVNLPDPSQPTGWSIFGKTDSKVLPAGAPVPTPTEFDNLKPATVALPDDPIEPYLLTKQNGPFMVMARTFRGPEAERYALALVKELRAVNHLPAYILRTKDFPHRSNIRNVPPTAPAYVNKSVVQQPEKTRSYDEAAVLVGDEKTLADSLALLHKVHLIKPKCLGGMPNIFGWREGLASAQRTTNPYVPTQDLFPGRPVRDRLVTQMNGGQRSINNCPGRYSIIVAEFNGRSVYNPTQGDGRMLGKNWLSRGPLETAAEDAERVADVLAKDPEVRRTGYQPYIYHDRVSSKVMIGSFNDPNDPKASQLREVVYRNAIPMSERLHAGIVIAPARTLTDLEDPDKPIK